MHGLMPLLFRIEVLPEPPLAVSVAPSDMSTSIVIHPDRSDQIQCRKTPIKTVKDIVYAAPKLPNGKSKPLKMDILIPEPVRKRTVVVYVPGGGFVVAAKEGALNLRTYVAEAGFVVASVEYRTTRDGANYRDGVEDQIGNPIYARTPANMESMPAMSPFGANPPVAILRPWSELRMTKSHLSRETMKIRAAMSRERSMILVLGHIEDCR